MIYPLHASRDQFLRPDGSNYNWRGHIHFLDFKKSLDGVSLNELIDPWKALGSESVTTLMMWHYGPEKFYPSDYGPRLFAHIKPFARALKDLQMYWRPIVFADANVIMPDVNQQHDFLNKCAVEFNNEWNVLPSLCNEFQKNGIDPGNFSRPVTNNMWSHGSAVGDTNAARPAWDYVEWHGRRDWPKVIFSNEDGWYVKEGLDGSNGHYYDRSVPGIVGEDIGFWDRDIPGRRSSDPNLAMVLGGTSIYYMRGGDFMSEEALSSSSPSPRTAECASRWFKAIAQND